MQGETGQPEDVFINSWHFFKEATPATDYDNVRDLLADFYTASPDGQASTVASTILSPSQISGDPIVRAYDLSDPMPRVPVYESSFELTGSVGGGLPWEVAMVLSFEAEPISGVRRARTRNRKYLGPIRASAVNSDGLFTTPAITMVAAAARDMLEASLASATWSWRVYSATAADSWLVHRGWVDDEPDTQRRRGRGATQRVEFAEGTPEV